MKIKPLFALGIPLASIAASLLFYLAGSEPAAKDDPGARASTVNRVLQPAHGDGLGVVPDRNPATADVSEVLLRKYAQSEDKRLKEIAEEQRPKYVAPPVVMLEVDAAMGLEPAQVKVIEKLRKSFVDRMEELGKDPASREYMEAWVKERQRADDLLQQQLGDDLFNKIGVMALAAMDTERKQAGK